MNNNNNNIIKVKDLEKISNRIRRHVISMIHEAGSGHPGGSLSCVDILTVLYFNKMHHDNTNPKWENRDIFILSKGHAAPTLYAVLAESKYFPIENLFTLRKFGSILQGHPDIKVPGIEISTGSLGQGLSIACGFAISGKLYNKNFKVYTLIGDGECNEGQIWEAAMFASHYKLNNLVAIIDRNHFQIDGSTEDIMSIEPFALKWKSFGWHVIEIDGHNILNIIISLDKVSTSRPTVIIANTIKGKGVSFMENNNSFHGRSPNKEETYIALKEL